jgi:hypothetical protein
MGSNKEYLWYIPYYWFSLGIIWFSFHVVHTQNTNISITILYKLST